MPETFVDVSAVHICHHKVGVLSINLLFFISKTENFLLNLCKKFRFIQSEYSQMSLPSNDLTDFVKIRLVSVISGDK